MRRFFAVLLAAMLAFALVGCAGGEPAPEADTETEAAAPAGESGSSTIPSAPPEGVVFEPFPVSAETPAAISEALAENQPFILFFYDDKQKATNDVRGQINEVMDDNDDLIDLYTYDLGQYAKVDSDGRVEVDTEALEEGSAGASTVALATDVGVAFLPYVVVVDSQGYIIYRHSGFIDAELLGRQVERVAE